MVELLLVVAGTVAEGADALEDPTLLPPGEVAEPELLLRGVVEAPEP